LDKLNSMPAYAKVFVALAVITLVEVWVAAIPAARVLIVTTLFVLTVCKAVLVALYYMHLRYDRKLLGYMALVPYLIALAMMAIILTDTTLRQVVPHPVVPAQEAPD
jgi:cytochrome c oxidase subunit 4